MLTRIEIELPSGKRSYVIASVPVVTDSETAWIAGDRIEQAVKRALEACANPRLRGAPP